MDTDELNRLIRSLNAGGEEAGASRLELVRGDEAGTEAGGESAAPEAAPLPAGLLALLTETVRRGGTDLLLVPGTPPAVRLHGRIEPLPGEPLGPQAIRGLVRPVLSAERRRRLAESGSVDLSLRVPAVGRFRVNVHRTQGGEAAALRPLPGRIPTLSELGLPVSLHDLTRAARGLVLVTGAAGSGKTTTLAALLDRVVGEEKKHVITIEDPVEYEHRTRKSIVEQIEIGADAPDFATALVSALRQNPDVLLVGEMRDEATARAVLTASETGHLVLTTAHTNDAPQTVHRILDLFPPAQQTQVRQQLSLCLSAIVCQQLVPRRDGSGRAVAVEILLATDAVRAHIRRGQLHHLHNEITLGRRLGMVTMDDSLAALVRDGAVSPEEARLRASHPDDLRA
ncbi:MAG: type IV pilus twitching motility protein PilT [Acidithiobacillales bacterium]